MSGAPVRPAHHRPDGGFANPWPDAEPAGSPLSLLKWQWQRIRHGTPPTPAASRFPTATPDVHADSARDELRMTWLGQSSFLIQTAGVNLLLDPVLSRRASPFSAFGPARIVAAPLSVAELPEIHGVVLSHDHYDHLDARTCRALLERFGAKLPFCTPIGYRRLLAKLGASHVLESDWWQDAPLQPDVQVVCLPAQHWTRRGMDTDARLWSSWLLRTDDYSIYFSGDSGYCPAFCDIRERVGAPDIAMLPIGAYEPRWFMKAAHMNPEEAVQSFLDLGAREFVAMHWGTFKLTDEPMLEPPERTRQEWTRRGLSPDHLHIPFHGETLIWRAKTLSTT